MAESMGCGTYSQCALVNRACTKSMEELKKYTSIFCSEKEPVLQCTTDRFSLGMCSANSGLGDLSQVCHHFENPASPGKGELINVCPTIRPYMETTCDTGNETLMPGCIVSKISRCLDLNEPQFKSINQRDGVKVKGICVNVKCEDGKVKVQYKTNEGDDKSVWHECRQQGQHIPLQNSVLTGASILCPWYEEVCTRLPETAPSTMNHEEVVVPERDVKKAQEQTTATGGSGHGAQTSDDGRTANYKNNSLTDSSIAASLFGLLVLLVCALAAVVTP